ncbi:MAG: metallophosphoesterase [Cyanobacteria bacterium SID2]|nr:metallophosphoesterase [Cyanobacteria bacterium SID2]
MSPFRYYLLILAISLLGLGLTFSMAVRETSFTTMSDKSPFLSDPFLQFPTPTSVRVVWFTEFRGLRHEVTAGNQTYIANTTRLSRTREDKNSQTPNRENSDRPQHREVWRHEAEVSGLTPGKHVPYFVSSQREDSEISNSAEFSLAATPKPGTPLKILLTSDHQLMPMTAANLQKAFETVGAIDAVFHAGDLVNVPDRASEWFDDGDGNAFFPCLQGYASYDLEKDGVTTRYRGAPIIQNAPLFPTIGNHEVMGRYSQVRTLDEQFNDAIARSAVKDWYDRDPKAANITGDPGLREAWMKTYSFNTDTFEELFSIPEKYPGGKTYYAASFGDVRLVVLFATNIWRKPQTDETVKGRYQERTDDLDNPMAWGYGQHIFEPIDRGSPQYEWLERELTSPEFQSAKYKIVMLHHPPHTLGGNIVPPYTNPVPKIDRDDDGNLLAVRYEYPKADDYLVRDVIPLLESAGVQLVYFGHSHLWNRFVSDRGTHYLESSNVGNTYGAFWKTERRKVLRENDPNYRAQGDPNGLEPVFPSIAPLRDESGSPLPYVASNDITAFSVFETETGTVASYYFDTRNPNSEVVKFDEFQLHSEK